MSQSQNTTKQKVETSIQILKKIKNKIDSLLKKSANDFIQLNSILKDYFNQINVAHKKNCQVLDSLSISQKLIPKKPGTSQIEAKVLKHRDSISETQNTLHGLRNDSKSIVLQSNNIRQDIGALRLLATNLRFDPELDSVHNSIIQQLDNINNCINRIEKDSGKLISEVETGLDFLNPINDRFYKQQITSIQLINQLFETATSIHSHNKSCELQEIVNEIKIKHESSLSDIITNLQYEDIIRQKIEHVQEAQFKIYEKLEICLNDDNEIDNQELLVQLKDIVTLQTAQLIHANKEYQASIEQIIRKFNDLEFILNQTQKYWQTVFRPINDEINKIVDLIINKIPQIQNNLNSFLNELNSTSDSSKTLIDNVRKSFLNIDDSTCMKTNLESLYNSIIGIRARILKMQTQNPLDHFISEIDRLKLSIVDISDIQCKSKIINFQVQPIKDQTFGIKDLDAELNKIFKNTSKALDKEIKITHNPSFNQLKQSQKKEVQFTLKDITYYEEFEKGVGEIITLLNELINNLDLRSDTGVNEKTVDEMKAIYTMESERRVHNDVTGKSKGKKTKDGTHDEIEFF